MDPGHYLNRELSWLDFNARVLALASDPNVPLLERAKFLAIFSQNLDEFFQVRVAGLKDQVAAGVSATTPDGRTPAQQLLDVRDAADALNETALLVFANEIVPALRGVGIVFSSWDELDDDDRKYLDEVFEERIYPVLTPLAVDPGHPFPYISDLSLNLAVVVRDPVTLARRFARVKVPLLLPRFVVMPDGERFVALESVIAAHLEALFPGMVIEGHYPFRVTRNADLTLEDEDADDLLAAVEFELRRRRFGRAVRLEVDTSMSSEMRELLERELDVDAEDVYEYAGPIDLGGLWSLHAVDRPDLKDPVWVPVTQARLARDDDERVNFFHEIRRGDILVHHPYSSFATSVEEFIRQASVDPKVLAIKLTLYRTSGDSSIIQSLIRAVEGGKQVAALVELKARFDEEKNIEWARSLEQAGVHVVYGLVGLKIHTKTTLVVREEQVGMRRYCHVGTGNYNPKTARLYEDIGLLTCDPDVGCRPHPAVQLPHRLRPRRRVPQAARGPARPAAAHRRAHRQRGPLRVGGAHRAQDEQPGRLRDDRLAVRRVAGRRVDRPDHPRHLLPAAGGAGPVGQHPRPLDRRPLPRARPHLPLRPRRSRRRADPLHRLGRSDAAQPRPPGRGARAGHRSRSAVPARRDPRGRTGRRRAGLVARHRRHLAQALGRGRDRLAPSSPRAGAGPATPGVSLAGTGRVEREVKLDADPDLVLPELDGVAPGISARPMAAVELDATYFDAPDHRLLAQGITVRRRTGEGTRWTVKLPAAERPTPDGPTIVGSLSRREVDIVDTATEPPAGVTDLVDPWLDGVALVAVARLVSSRRRVELCATERDDVVVVAELDDDLVVVHDDDGEVGRFREIEVELAHGRDASTAGATDDAVVDAVIARLVGAGARRGGSQPKVERALALLAG